MKKKDKGYLEDQILRIASATSYIGSALKLLNEDVLMLKNELLKLTHQHEDKGEN